MYSTKIFWRRLVQEYKFQSGVIRSVIDWTVIVYFILPILIVVPFFYAEAWDSIHFYWNETIPFAFLLFLILLLSCSGNFRTYLVEADLLHLIQRKEIVRQLKRYAFFFSVLQSMIGVAFLIMVILPVLVLVYGFSPTDVLFLYLAITAFRFFVFTLKKIISRKLTRYIFLFLTFMTAFLFMLYIDPVFYGIGSMVCLLLISTYYLAVVVKTSRWFYREIEIEGIERYRYIKLIFTFSQELELESSDRSEKPILFFRKSKRMFKQRNQKNGLLELLLKAFLRDKKQLTMYFQVTLFTCSVIMILPIWLKWLVFIGFLLFIHSWLKHLYNKLLADPFFHVVPFEKELSVSVWSDFKKRIAFPPVALTGLWTMLLTFLSF